MFRLAGFIAIAAVSGASPLAVLADTVTLTPVADTALWQENPTNNLGGELSVPVGANSSSNISRGLFRFNLAAVPTNAIVTNVALQLFVTNAPAKTNPVNSGFVLHRVLRDWGEGNKISGDVGKNGAQATAGEATWEARFYSNTLWSTPGASSPLDYNAGLSASNFVIGLGNYVFSDTNLIRDVQAWISNPATNYGWLLRSLAESTAFSTRRFASREDGLNPPKLTVMYLLAGPPQPKIIDPHWTSSSFWFSFGATPGQSYAVEFSEPLAASWQTLTNILTPPGVTNLSVTNQISGQARRFYRLKTL